MNSKEALKLAILEYEKDLETDENNQWVKNVLKGLKKLEQDLDKLEKLEKVIDILRRKILIVKTPNGIEFRIYEKITQQDYMLLQEVLYND